MALRKTQLREGKGNSHTWRRLYKPSLWKMIINQIHKELTTCNGRKVSWPGVKAWRSHSPEDAYRQRSMSSRIVSHQGDHGNHPIGWAQMRMPNGCEDTERPGDACCGFELACATLKHGLLVSLRTKHTIVICSLDCQRVPHYRESLMFTHVNLCVNIYSSCTRGVCTLEKMNESDHDAVLMSWNIQTGRWTVDFTTSMSFWSTVVRDNGQSQKDTKTM